MKISLDVINIPDGIVMALQYVLTYLWNALRKTNSEKSTIFIRHFSLSNSVSLAFFFIFDCQIIKYLRCSSFSDRISDGFWHPNTLVTVVGWTINAVKEVQMLPQQNKFMAFSLILNAISTKRLHRWLVSLFLLSVKWYHFPGGINQLGQRLHSYTL